MQQNSPNATQISASQVKETEPEIYEILSIHFSGKEFSGNVKELDTEGFQSVKNSAFVSEKLVEGGKVLLHKNGAIHIGDAAYFFKSLN